MCSVFVWLAGSVLSLISINANQAATVHKPSPQLAGHLASIAGLAQSAPTVQIPAGEFTVGSKRIDDDPYGPWTQFDDTELPQQRVWLDAYAIDRHEVSLAEYLSHLRLTNQHPADELQKLIWHVITVHSVSDHTLARWPALYITWHEAARFCASKGKRLPTEAEWEKAARGPDGQLFPWGDAPPSSERAMFGQHHVHEIPFWLLWTRTPRDEVPTAYITWQAMWRSGCRIGLAWTTTPICRERIQAVRQADAIRACAAARGRAGLLCFAPPLEAASVPTSGRPPLVFAVHNLLRTLIPNDNDPPSCCRPVR
jgi:Sulfatase-modifying factor enzyme 1